MDKIIEGLKELKLVSCDIKLPIPEYDDIYRDYYYPDMQAKLETSFMDNYGEINISITSYHKDFEKFRSMVQEKMECEWNKK